MHEYLTLLLSFGQQGAWSLVRRFFPFIMIIEMPYYALSLSAALYTFYRETFSAPKTLPYRPVVSCVLSCYAEGPMVRQCLETFVEQLYPGILDILVVIDGAPQNQSTVEGAMSYLRGATLPSNRSVRVIPRPVRGGRASNLNLGLSLAQGELVLAFDGDSSVDNDAIQHLVDDFSDPHIVGVAGTLRVRNAGVGLVTALQALEYMLGIHLGRMGLSTLNSLNNISGAFGIFRRSFLLKIGAWRNGTAEDLDLTTRIEAYFKRAPHLRMKYNHRSIGHTDGPDTWLGLFKQRMRWEGDLYYILCRRNWKLLRPRHGGWKAFIVRMWGGVVLNVALPLTLLIFLVYTMLVHGPVVLAVVLTLSYIYYLGVTIFLFTVYFILVSERKRYDARFLPLLPFLPLYTMGMRVVTAIALLFEIFLHTHMDTTMAPRWVLRKTR